MKFKIYVQDVIQALKQMPNNSIDCVCTSPPYWGLRSYLKKDNPLKEFEIGTEPNPQEYITKIADIFDEVKKVLKPFGTCWLNLGDTFFGGGGGNQYSEQNVGILAKAFKKDAELEESAGFSYSYRNKCKDDKWLQPKQLLGIPWRIAIEMQSRGWLLRNSLIWRKLNHMPSSVKDRLSCSYEFIFLFAKNRKYFFNLDAVRMPHKTISIERACRGLKEGKATTGEYAIATKTREFVGYDKINELFSSGELKHSVHPLGRNPGDFLNTKHDESEPTDILETTLEPLSESHFAAFPTSLPRFALKAGCPKEVCSKCGKPKEAIIETNNPFGITGRKGKPMVEEGIVDLDERGKRISPGHDSSVYSTAKVVGYSDCGCENKEFVPGIVLDPFLGSGTTFVVAQELGLNAWGVELNPQFASIILRRLNCRTKIAPNKYSNPLSEVEFISEQEINYEPKKENFYMPEQKKILEEKP